jgi:hypothetical protein
MQPVGTTLMAISLASLKRRDRDRPPIILLYGVKGIGKTTFAAGSPNPVVAAVEDGLGALDVPFWNIASWDDMMQAVGILYSEDHDRKSLVVDSLDWLEPHVLAETCRRNGWPNIEAPGYGKGYVAAAGVWREYLEGIRALRDEKNMLVIQIAHEQIKRFDNPDTEPYDRYQIKLHDRASALVQEHADIVAFMNYRVSIRQSDVGFNKKVARAVGGGQRVLFLEERPAYLAKNRFAMPISIDLPSLEQAAEHPDEVWNALAQYLPNLEQNRG